jgi:lysozyme family protein
MDDLRNLTADEAKEIYTDRWKRVHGDDLPSGLDYAVFDASTMIGINGSLALLNQTPKGETDAETALLFLIHLFNIKMHSDSVGKFGKGWGDRIMRVANRAREMK